MKGWASSGPQWAAKEACCSQLLEELGVDALGEGQAGHDGADGGGQALHGEAGVGLVGPTFGHPALDAGTGVVVGEQAVEVVGEGHAVPRGTLLRSEVLCCSASFAISK